MNRWSRTRAEALNRAKRLLPVLNLVLFGVLLYLIGARDIVRPSDGWNWTDFITILMTVVTIVLAALGIILALAAIIGYQALSDQSKKQANETSREAANDFLTSETFRSQVASVVAEQMRTYNREQALESVHAGAPVEAGPSTPGDERDTEWSDE